MSVHHPTTPFQDLGAKVSLQCGHFGPSVLEREHPILPQREGGRRIGVGEERRGFRHLQVWAVGPLNRHLDRVEVVGSFEPRQQCALNCPLGHDERRRREAAFEIL
jgi:hypothetical protein